MKNFLPVSITSTLIAVSIIISSVSVARAQPSLGVEIIKDGLASPLFVTAPPEDSARIFVIEQGGKIKIIRLSDRSVSTFLDISGKVVAGGERGLLGMAFHPSYKTNGKFYVYYSASGGGSGGHSVVARYTVSADPDLADVTSELIILTENQPESNHNGGMIAFGPNDGFLYIGFGDGGSAAGIGRASRRR